MTGRRTTARNQRARSELITILWRDIPAQVTARSGRNKMAVELPGRFQTAIDRAAMVAGCHTYSEYIEEWRRTATPCGQDVEAEAKAAAARIERDYPNERLFSHRGERRVRRIRGVLRDVAGREQGQGAMTTTVVSSATKEVVIGPDRPFVVIGERINPTGRKLLAAEMREGDYHRVEADALAQVAAGAHMLDVNAGIPLADEPAILAESIQLVQSLVDVPLAIDSSIVEALEAGLAVYKARPGQLGDRRGGASRAGPAAGGKVRGGGGGDLQRRVRYLRGPRRDGSRSRPRS